MLHWGKSGIVIGLDLDGTVIAYMDKSVRDTWTEPDVNYPLIHSVAGAQVAVITNQGGLPFGIAGFRGYSTPDIFAARLDLALEALEDAGCRPTGVFVSVFHPRADTAWIEQAARRTRDRLRLIGRRRPDMVWHVYATARSRKPSPYMLQAAGVDMYYGDSVEDEQAAAAAGVQFVEVRRFFG